jgi:hypothetical protein
MKIHVEILDDNNEIIGEHMADASTPSVWNAPSGKPLVSKMPQNSDNENTGTYELYRLTIQPVVRVNRPNGYKEPAPSPMSAAVPRPLYDKQPAPWGTNAPTQRTPQAPSSLGSAPTRGY